MFDGMCATNRTANPGFSLSSVPDVNDVLDVFLRDRVEPRNAAIERLVELAVLLLRTSHVHNVSRVVAGLYCFTRVLYLLFGCLSKD